MNENKTKNFLKSFKKFWTNIGNWFINLGHGYVTGIEDLFLASWKKIAALLLLIIVPTIYGLSMSYAYWNPSNNLNKLPIAIMDEDHPIVLVQQTLKDKDVYTYKIGALLSDGIEDENGKVYGSEDNLKVDDMNNKINQIENSNSKTLYTNTGKIEYNPKNTIITLASTWDSMKSIMIKDKPNREDTDSKFELKVSPLPQLKFNDIKYINDKDEINSSWHNPKYLGQVKISKGYQAQLVQIMGYLFGEKDDSKIDNAIKNMKDNKKIQAWSTLQRNFLIGYLVNTYVGFKDYLLAGITPVIDTMESAQKEQRLFTILGSKLKDSIIPEMNNNLEDSSKYYVKDTTNIKPEDVNNQFVRSSTLFGDNNKIIQEGQNNGRIGEWLDQINSFSNDKLELLSKIMPDSYNFFKLMIDAFSSVETNDKAQSAKFDESKAMNTIKYFLTGDKDYENEWNSFTQFLKSNLTKDDHLQIQNPEKWFFTSDNNGIVELNSQQNITKYISDFMKTGDNKKIFAGATSLTQLASAYAQIKTTQITHGFDLNSTYDVTVQGKQNGQMPVYGIGMGSMFFIIGLFIGANMLRGVITRDKQYSKLNFASWFLSKFMIFCTIGFVQVTLQVWFIYAILWRSQLSGAAMAFDYLWILQADMTLIAVIIGLQYLFSSAFLGAIVSILYLMLNVGSGGGSYPALLQKQFYWDIHWLLPFNYIMSGLDEIHFGVNILGTNQVSTDFLLQSWGFLWCFIAVFLCIGLVSSYFRIRQVTYGSYHGKLVLQALETLGRETANQFKSERKIFNGKKINVYHWEVLRQRFDVELYETVRNIQRKKYGFKWYVNKRKKQKINDNLVDR